LKEIVKSGPLGAKEVEDIDLEILDNNERCNINDKLNITYKILII